MLRKINRIGNKKVIEKLLSKGKLHKNPFLVFKYEESEAKPSQFAVIVSKKIYKKAVKRNHLRRQIYEIVRLNLDNLKGNFKMLIIARPNCQKTNFQELSQNITSFFNTIQSNAE